MKNIVNKLPVNSVWFDRLTTQGAKRDYEWLMSLCDLVESIADFGCMTSEPLILLWILDATEVIVIEEIEDNLDTAKQDKEILKKTLPESLQGRSVEFISPRDMSKRIDELSPSYFDLAYCDRVLYNMLPDLPKVQKAISEMARVVKPGGFIIAVDKRIDAALATQLFQKLKR